jgi:formate--tetrahydrofolate ligase
VALNQFGTDSPEELAAVQNFCRAQGVACAVADVFGQGGAGAVALAQTLVDALPATNPPLPFLYRDDEPVEQKLHNIATRMYGADGVVLTAEAQGKLALFTKGGFQRLPICMAKTQDSLTDDPKISGRPRGFKITVRDFEIANGAGYLVALTGQMMRMPALPRVPAAERIDVADDGTITGM